MPSKVRFVSEQPVYEHGPFRLIKACLTHERYDGTMSEEIVRLNFQRGDSVAALLHDQEAATVILVQQFRYPTLHKGPGWILELPAGAMEASDKEQLAAMRREVMEELGYEVESLRADCQNKWPFILAIRNYAAS